MAPGVPTMAMGTAGAGGAPPLRPIAPLGSVEPRRWPRRPTSKLLVLLSTRRRRADSPPSGGRANSYPCQDLMDLGSLAGACRPSARRIATASARARTTKSAISKSSAGREKCSTSKTSAAYTSVPVTSSTRVHPAAALYERQLRSGYHPTCVVYRPPGDPLEISSGPIAESHEKPAARIHDCPHHRYHLAC